MVKYLAQDSFTALTATLSGAIIGRSRVLHGRIEAYTMKRAGSDRKYAQTLGEKYVQELQDLEDLQLPTSRKRSQSAGMFEEVDRKKAKHARARSNSCDIRTARSRSDETNRDRSKSHDFVSQSALGDFFDQGTRKLMTDLILTLNASFPDYDFGNVRPNDFEKVTQVQAMEKVNSRLIELQGNDFLTSLWRDVDQVTDLADCDVYTYQKEDQDFLLHSLADDEDTIDTNESQSILWSFNYFFVNKHLKRIVFFTCIETMLHAEQAEDTVEYVSMAADSAEMDFDLDPSASTAGGIPISTA